MKINERIAILIPAYQPDERLISLIEDLRDMDSCIVIVNDGSDESRNEIFERAAALGAHVLVHEKNRGKGIALKTGFAFINDSVSESGQDFAGVITADADGQHCPDDIRRIAEAMLKSPQKFLIGSRMLDENSPLRSRVGNALSKLAFRLMTSLNIHDTQSGLRAIPLRLLPNMIALSGTRYEYEMNVLLQLKNWQVVCEEIPIKTIYINENEGSHFRGFSDAVRVFSQLLRFALSSLMSFGVDFGVYSLLISLFRWKISDAYILARFISAAFNYSINRKVVFSHRGNAARSAILYAGLALVIMTLGANSVDLLVSSGVNALLAKVLADSVLFMMSYYVQRKIIFNTNQELNTIMIQNDIEKR